MVIVKMSFKTLCALSASQCLFGATVGWSLRANSPAEWFLVIGLTLVGAAFVAIATHTVCFIKDIKDGVHSYVTPTKHPTLGCYELRLENGRWSVFDTDGQIYVGTRDGAKKQYDNFEDALFSIQFKHPLDEWINIEDKLPEAFGTYLVTLEDDTGFRFAHKSDYVLELPDKLKCYWMVERAYQSEDRTFKVVAWMPLPAPSMKDE